MKKLSRCIYILLVCALFATGCNARTYSYVTESTEDSSVTNPTTEEQPTETTPEETTTEKSDNFEETTLPPTPYELLLAGNPLNNAGNIFKIDSDITINQDSYIPAFFEWLDGVILAVYDYTSGELHIFYIDPISHEIYSQMTITAQEYSTRVFAGANNTLIVADLFNSCIDIYDKNFVLLNNFPTPDSVRFSDFPLLSKDCKYAYYSDEFGSVCYRMDLDTGISEPVFNSGSEDISKTPSFIIFDNQREILIMSVYDGITFESTYEYYDTATFELIQSNSLQAHFEPCGDGRYGGRVYDTVEQLIYLPELNSETVKEFFPESDDEYYSYWFTSGDLLFTFIDFEATKDEELYNHSRIRAYDLNTGLCAYETIVSFNDEDYFGGYMPQLIYSEKYNAAIGTFVNDKYNFFLWDLNAESSRSSDETVYMGEFYAPDEVNWDGIAALKASANELSVKYGVNICIADDTRTDTGDYYAEQVFQTALIRNALTILDEALANYPKDFFYQLQNEDGVPLEINLSGTISPADGYDSINTAIGLHNYNSGNQYVILDINNHYFLKTTIYHEIFHAIDWIVVYNSILFDSDWHELNPDDFEYDYGYNSNESNYDTTYLYYTDEGYFIDIYSKSFPNEDRARIMENAMSGNYYYFESEGLYSKLSYICHALREVFDSSTWEEPTCWEAALLPTEDDFTENIPEDIPETTIN